MTDKEKIRKEVEKIARSINPYIPDEEGKNSEYEAGRFAMATQIMQIIDSLQEEPVSETNKVVQKHRCLEEVATTINPFIDEVIEQFNLKDKSIVAKEIQYRGIGIKNDFHEDIHRSDDEVIYILKEDKAVGLVVIRRTEFNNAEITMVKTEERFKDKKDD